MNEKFEKILLDNEQIIKIYKPLKKKFITKISLFFLFPLIFFIPFFTIYFTVFFNSGFGPEQYLFLIVPILMFTASLIIIICSLFSYKNVFYAITDKRFIIRRGILGVDFLTLEINVISSVNVVVSPLDKMFKNTGSIIFLSPSNPSNLKYNFFKFADINSPYEEYKFISSFINDKKLSSDDK